MSDLVRIKPVDRQVLSSLAAIADPGSSTAAALVRGRYAAQLQDMSEPSLDSTLAFVERAAELLRTLQRDNDAANRQIVVLREQLQRERQDRQGDSEKIDQFVRETNRKVAASEAQLTETKALAVTAIRRCEEMAASEAAALQRAKSAEARAAEVEDCLLGLQKAIAFEFSSILP